MVGFTITLSMVVTLTQQLIELVCNVKNRIEAFKLELGNLEFTLKIMGPAFEAGSTWFSDEKVLKEIEEKLEAGRVLVEKCDKLSSGSVRRKCRYCEKISKFNADLANFCLQKLTVENLLAIRRILKELEQLRLSLSVQQSSIKGKKLNVTMRQSSSLALTPQQFEKLSTFAAATLQGGKQGSESHSTSDLTSVHVLVAWTPPPCRFLKYNVNGVCHGNPGKKKKSHGNPAPAGIGGVCRDANGTFIHCFHEGVGYSNALEAEALAIRKGLLVAADRGHRRIYIESSCEMIIKILAQFGASTPDTPDTPGGLSSSISLKCPTDEIASIITKILNFKDHFKEVFFCYISKEGNYVAASLASTAATAAIHPDPKFWDCS